MTKSNKSLGGARSAEFVRRSNVPTPQRVNVPVKTNAGPGKTTAVKK